MQNNDDNKLKIWVYACMYMQRHPQENKGSQYYVWNVCQ